MSRRYTITKAQKNELSEARKKNKNKRVEKRLHALLKRAEGKSYKEISEETELHADTVRKYVSTYCNQGLETIVGNHYKGNRRNMSVEEERAFLEPYKKQAERGELIEVSAIKRAYEDKVGHSIGGTQIYYVLRRHGWRKLMPRSKHPNKASDGAIEASKKLTKLSTARWKILPQERSD